MQERTDGSRLTLEGLTRRFGSYAAVEGLTLAMAEGELVALVGASGSGKTTTLRMVAGYERPDAGRVLLDDRDITHLAPQHREFGMVFQHYALFPHLSVEENVAFGLEARGVARDARLSRARETLALVGLPEMGKRAVQALSGGEQQRVALARALVIHPRALLLDEPLSNLDPTLREAMRNELRAMLRRAGVTALFVTHDQDDAFALADRIALLRRGRLLQVGTPEEIYHRPASKAVAEFIGRATIVAARVDDGRATVTIGGVTIGLDSVLPSGSGALWAVIRPESLSLAPMDTPHAWPGVVTERRFTGPVTFVTITLGDELTIEIACRDGAPRVGERIAVRVDGSRVPLVRDSAESGSA